VDRKGPTVYFSDIWLEGADAPTPASGGAPTGPQPLVGYKIKGKVGDLNVDLTITPFPILGGGGPKAAAPPVPQRPGEVGSHQGGEDAEGR